MQEVARVQFHVIAMPQIFDIGMPPLIHSLTHRHVTTNPPVSDSTVRNAKWQAASFGGKWFSTVVGSQVSKAASAEEEEAERGNGRGARLRDL